MSEKRGKKKLNKNEKKVKGSNENTIEIKDGSIVVKPSCVYK